MHCYLQLFLNLRYCTQLYIGIPVIYLMYIVIPLLVAPEHVIPLIKYKGNGHEAPSSKILFICQARKFGFPSPKIVIYR